MLDILFVALAGRLLVHLIQGLPASKKMSVKWLDGWFIELFHCDLCLGVWINFILCGFYGIYFRVSGVPYIPLVNEVITAASISWFMHIFFLGLKLRYGTFDTAG